MNDQAGQLPWITVITAVYNDAANLEATLASIAALGYPQLEYRVVDGGSSDGTVELLRRHENSPVTAWTSAPDRGIYDAMNKGWQASRDDSLILFLGAGDCLLSLPDMTNLRGGEVLFGQVTIGDRRFNASADWRLTCGNTLHHQALLVPKRLHPEPPFDTQFRMYADFDFNQRLMRRGAHFVRAAGFVASALPGGLSSRKDYREMLRVVAHNFGLAGLVRALLYLPVNKMLRAMTSGTQP
jgi:glycosyltransferase involved in cell wall biosynthesis